MAEAWTEDWICSVDPDASFWVFADGTGFDEDSTTAADWGEDTDSEVEGFSETAATVGTDEAVEREDADADADAGIDDVEEAADGCSSSRNLTGRRTLMISSGSVVFHFSNDSINSILMNDEWWINKNIQHQQCL